MGYDVGTTLLHDGLGLESLADKHINNVQKLKVAINQGERICELFQAFTKKEYFYETNIIEKWIASARNEMTSNNQYPNQYVPSNNPFNVDSTEIVWNTYLQCFAYGIRKYILAEDMTDFPKETLSHYDIQLTTQNINDFQHDHSKLSFPSVFSDLTWTLTHSRKPGYTKRGVFGKILDWSGWQEEEDKKKKNHSKNKQEKETKEYIKERIERTKNEMEAMVLSSQSVRSATQLYDDLFS